jgi:type I restriction enzyme S subunit
MSEWNGDLPDGWVKATIEELCDFNPKHNGELSDETLVSFVPMAALSDVLGTIIEPQVRMLGEVRKGYTHFADGDVIFAKITPCMENGKAASVRGMTNSLACGTTEFYVFRPRGAIDPDFLFQFIRQSSYRRAARATMQSGVGQARVPKEFVLKTELLVPPLAEQKRIIAKIEALQERSQRAREALSEVEPLLEQFRQSVLAAAFRGDLTADWRTAHPNVEPASELLHRIRVERRRRWEQAELSKYEAKGEEPPKSWQEKYKEPAPVDDSDLPELPAGWVWAMIDELTSFITSGSRGWAKYYSDAGPLFIRAQNIKTDCLVMDDIAHVKPPVGSEGERTRVTRDDLLITITGANVTKAALVDINIDEAYVSQHVALVRLVEPMLAKYLHLWTISSANGRSQLLADAYGNGKPGLNLDNIRTMAVALPPATEQVALLAMLEEMLLKADLLSRDVQAVENDSNHLDQSIHAKAFRGELVPQDPSDEPASMLLERIRAQRKRQAKAPGKNSSRLEPQQLTLAEVLRTAD